MRGLIINIVVILFVWLICSNQGFSQNYRVLRAGFGVGITGGLLAYFEPSVRITDRFSLGYRSESGFFILWAGFDHYQMASKGAVFQYYFATHDEHFFVGLGLANYVCSPSSSSRVANSSTGFFPRIGVDMGHFTFCLDYNIINDFALLKNPPHPSQTAKMVNRNYFSIRFGLTIGGGRKKLKAVKSNGVAPPRGTGGTFSEPSGIDHFKQY